jgi:hypothetical protein
MQAQNPLDPYYALWSRVPQFDEQLLADGVERGGVVRAAAMRGTIHLFTAADYRRLQPVFADVLERVFRSTQFAKDLATIDRALLLAEARRLLGGQPMRRVDLARLLAETWRDVPEASLGQAATYLLPVVQVPPRGVWGRTGEARWALADDWMGGSTAEPATVDEVVTRYLRAFGPATVPDVRTWSGLTGLRDVVDRLRPQLRVWRTEDGAELLDLPDAIHPDPDTPAPVRFLPEYDNLLLAHADRSRFFGDVFPPGWVGNLLVDGFYVGWWKPEKTKQGMVLRITTPGRLPKRQSDDVEAEGSALLGWATGEQVQVVFDVS